VVPDLSAASLLGRAPGARSGLAGARILVVEDDRDCRELIRMFLERAAATVFCVDSVAAGMDCVYRSFDPDVVLTDYSMPGRTAWSSSASFGRRPPAGRSPFPSWSSAGTTRRTGARGPWPRAPPTCSPKPFDPVVLIYRGSRPAVAAGRSGPH